MIKEASLSQAIDAANLALLLWPNTNSVIFLAYAQTQAIGHHHS